MNGNPGDIMKSTGKNTRRIEVDTISNSSVIAGIQDTLSTGRRNKGTITVNTMVGTTGTKEIKAITGIRVESNWTFLA